jgi:hypothetical protein
MGGGPTKAVYLIASVREQTAVSGIVRCGKDRRYVCSGCRRYDRHAMRARGCIRGNDMTASRLAPNVPDGRFDFFVAANRRNDWHGLE